jgi:hypothetical protein
MNRKQYGPNKATFDRDSEDSEKKKKPSEGIDEFDDINRFLSDDERTPP